MNSRRNLPQSFRVGGLPTVYHTEETWQVFEDCRGNFKTQSRFVASAVLKYAQSLGFNLSNSYKATSEDRFNLIAEMEKKSRCVDYAYLWAFEYLRIKEPLAKKSDLLRLAILNY